MRKKEKPARIPGLSYYMVKSQSAYWGSWLQTDWLEFAEERS